MREIELISRRKEREKHFLREDGTCIARVYDKDIHYIKDGKYEEIDYSSKKEKNRALNSTTSIHDTYIFPGDTNVTRYDKEYLKAGVEKVNNQDVINRTLIKFELPTLSTGDEVIYANFDLFGYFTHTQFPTEYYATIHRVTEDWAEQTANWNSMNNKYDPYVESLFIGSRSPIINNVINLYGNTYDGNITNLVKRWYKDTPNYGIMVKSLKEEYIDDDYLAFYSKDNTYSSDNNPQPIFEVQYRNQNGLESYLNYKTQSFTEGTSYVNTYNGNLTTVFNIGHTLGGSLPASLNIVYNTNDVVLENETNFGIGYRLNLEQTLKELQIDNHNYLSYTDEDGTIHYFKESSDSNIYDDEDGLNLKITKETNKYTMYDDDDNVMEFTKIGSIYYLTSIKDIDNNTITINLGNNNEIVSVTDSNNNTISLTYNGNNITITSPDETNTLSYTNNKLSSLTTIRGTTLFSYDSNNLLESITDLTGLRIEYDYYSNSPYKARKVTHYGLNNTEGEYFTLDYGFETTKIIDNKNRCSTLIFNNSGNLLSSNSMETEEDLDNAYSISNEVGTETNTKNRITSSTIPTRIIKNLLTNTSFEENNNIFTSSTNLTMTLSEDCSNSGYKSLKCVSTSDEEYIETTKSVPKDSSYTFSGYIKSTTPYTIILSYLDNNNVLQKESVNCNTSTIFEREDISIFYPEDATSNLSIKVILDEIGTLYMDDIQLEEGDVANSYNIIENNNFKNGYSDWTATAITFDESTIDVDDYLSVVSFNDNQSSALKIEANPMYTIKLEKTFSISGEEGDLYSFSFWYKNEGLPGYGPLLSTNVMIYFKPIGEDAEYCIPISEGLNVNRDKWQFFTYRSHAPEDYESIRIELYVAREANDFYITNLSFNKEVTSGDYEYDNHGNLKSITDQSNNTNAFKYNSDNQLIKATNTLGQSTIYEYDINKKSRVINSISHNGISNRIKYNSIGSPIITRTSKRYKNEITTGLYKIRCSGTNKYLKAELNLVLLEESECSNTIWRIVKEEDTYKIINNQNDDYSLTYDGSNISLTLSNTNNIFMLEKNDNGSYHIKYNDTTTGEGTIIRFLTANNNIIEGNEYNTDCQEIEFYIELVDELFMENSANYTSDNRFVNEVTDTTLKKVTYNTDSTTGLLTSLTDPKNHTTSYTYNNKRQCTKISQDDIDINYTYNQNNLISSINQGNKTYSFTYNDFLNLTTVKLNNIITFSTNEYEPNNGNLIRTTYGNTDYINLSYDNFDRISRITKMDDIYNYYYDNNGNVSKVISNYNKRKYLYDKSDRLYLYKNNDLKVKYTYDSENYITNKNYYLNNLSNYQNNTFDDEKLLSTNLDNSTIITYGYDELLRNTSKNINNIVNTTTSFYSLGKRTSNVIKEYTVNNDNYKYVYDDLFNITDIYLNNTLIKHYEYDNYNELTLEINYDLNNKYTYLYDLSGNLLKKTLINLTNNDIIKEYNYSYTNSNWEDQLTTFDGNSITYDSIGNMASFDGANYTWTNGVELSLYSNNDNNTYVSYKYDDKGIRYYKNINGTDINYYTLNNDILYEVRGNNVLYYLYDSDGLIGFDYNNTRYYYIKNMHDDIIGIVNSNGTKIVSYTYDSWGNIISIKDNNNQEISQEDYTNIANINPFRYRSYYYDVETRLYYLNHRYYNPRINRFISPDIIIGSNQDILSSNLYLYVGNNPINSNDDDGLKGKSLKTALMKIKNKIKKIVKSVSKTSIGKSIIKVKYTNTVKTSGQEKFNDIVSNSIAQTSTKITTSVSGNKNSLITITRDYKGANLQNTDIDMNYGIVSIGIRKDNDSVFASATVPVGEHSLKNLYGMNKSGEAIVRGEFDINVGNNAVQSISIEQKFPSQLTFAVVTIVAVDLALVPAAGVVCGIQGFVSKIPKVIAGSGGLLPAFG